MRADILLLRDDVRTEADKCRNDGALDIAELLDEVAGYLAETNELVTWTPVASGEYPDDETTVLLHRPGEDPVAGYRLGGLWLKQHGPFEMADVLMGVTHWAPMLTGPGGES